MEQPLEKNQQRPKKKPHLLPVTPLYSVSKLLKETSSLVNLNAFKLNIQSHHARYQHSRSKGLPSIIDQMRIHQADMQTTIYRNHSKLNSSFSGYFHSQIGLNKEELMKKKITKLKKAEEKGKLLVETPPVERDEGGHLDMSIKLTPLLNRCFDSLFPAIRYNATLFSNEKQVYLLGGYHQQGLEGLSLFHKYDWQGRKWVQIKSQTQSPKLSPCFHTVQIYRNNLVIIGGVSFEGEKGKRFNTDLLIYSFERCEWLRGRGGVSLKHHATTLFGTTIMISGGINEKQKYSEQLYFITFTGGNIVNPLIFSVKNQAEVNEKIAHHKIVHTYELDSSLRNQIKMQGVFSFGGQNENGIMNNDLIFINVFGKAGQNLDIKFKKWELVTTNNEKPCPRKDHSFNMINKKGIAVLAGGIQESGNWLADVWLFDFVRHMWTEVSTVPSVPESIGTLAGHCACANGSIIYIYNGNVQKKRQRAFWALQTESTIFKSKKNIFSTKLPTFKSIRSEKENCSLGKI